MAGTVNIYNIYYGDFSSTVGTQFKSLIDYFAQTVGGSSWYNIMSTYYQTIGGTTTKASNIVTWKKSVATATTQQAGTLSQSQIETVIKNLITSGQLPLDTNGIYAFVFRGDIGVSYGGSSWAGASSTGEWCGLHTSFTLSNSNINYFIAGDTNNAPYPSGCRALSGSTANGNTGADGTVSVYAHELVETVSNTYGAWWDSLPSSTTYGYENGDMCAWTFGTLLPGSSNANAVVGGKKWLLQQNWLPTVGGCRQQYP